MANVLVFAADTLIRFRDGRMLLHTTSSALPAFQTDQPMLIGWLCQFARPTDMSQAIVRLSEADRAAIVPVLDYLQRIGALVARDDVAEDLDATQHRSGQHLKMLARGVYDLACDVLAFGPYAEREIAAKTGIGVERRLMALLAGVDGLRAEFTGLRQAFVAQQLRALEVDATSRDLRLHIGCGLKHLDGWINIDVHPAPLAMSVTWGLPFADGSASHVFVSHMLEHLFYPKDAGAFLDEVRRVLAPGGMVRVIVPDIEQCLSAYMKNDREFFDGRAEVWGEWSKAPTRIEQFLAYAGAGPEPGYLFEAHKFGYDFETLAQALSERGFVDIRRSDFMTSDDPVLRVDDVSDTAAARYGSRHYSLFVEARRGPGEPA